MSIAFEVEAAAADDGFRISVNSSAGDSKSYMVPTGTQQDFAAFYRELARDFGTRVPHVFAERAEHPEQAISWRPLLTENIHPKLLVGYGDPAVLKADDGWWLVATSNDAPDAFPILHSTDLSHWEPRGFVFPKGHEPRWAAKGRNVADFWAPEIARVGDEYWLCFTARQISNALAIGLARAPTPEGPWVDNGAPLVTGTPIDTTELGFDPSKPQMSGGVIDSHILVDANGETYLFLEDERNSISPPPLAILRPGPSALIG